MKRIAASSDREVWFEQLQRPFRFESPFDGGDFALMLVTNDPTVTAEERSALCDEVIGQGCRYAVCAGHQCSVWHDDIDMTYLATDSNFNPPNERFVMTTWHEHEPLGEVVEFFLLTTSFDSFRPTKFLIVFVGANPAAEEEIRQALGEWLPEVPSSGLSDDEQEVK